MKLKSKILLIGFLILLSIALIVLKTKPISVDKEILAYRINTKTRNLQFYWKNDAGVPLKSILNLKRFVESKNQNLIFAMNGGMYNKDLSPTGLFIQNHKTLAVLNTRIGADNFYLKPNGVFYITKDNTPVICKTTDFRYNEDIKFATQSGPMLIVDGQIHSDFKEKSDNRNIRNGVGILPDNTVVFAMSKSEINFYDFAKYFESIGCRNALYLDGYVSRMYLPEKEWIQTDGNFGVIIGLTEDKSK